MDRSLELYLKAIKRKEAPSLSEKSIKLLKIGALASGVQETVPTLRYWTKEGLLTVAHITPSGYHLYAVSMIERIKLIQQLKSQRYTLKEIKEKLGD